MGECEGTLHPNAQDGILLFNQGRYFEAHEELELAWRAERGRIRELYQGILEAGVAYLHLRRQNLAGALKVHSRSMRWLQPWPDVCRGVAVERLRQDLDSAVAEARRLGPTRLAEFDAKFFRPIVWDEGKHESASS